MQDEILKKLIQKRSRNETKYEPRKRNKAKNKGNSFLSV